MTIWLDVGSALKTLVLLSVPTHQLPSVEITENKLASNNEAQLPSPLKNDFLLADEAAGTNPLTPSV